MEGETKGDSYCMKSWVVGSLPLTFVSPFILNLNDQ